MHVVVVGAGVIGLSCAVALRARGADVTVLERAVPGAGASSGNAGWITPVFAAPLPEPGIIPASIKWILRRDGPLSITPRLDPAFFRWLWSFWRSANAKDFERSVRAYAGFAAHALADFDAVAREIPVTIESRGTLFLFTSRAGLEHLQHQVELMGEFGYSRADVVGRLAAHDLEPAISRQVVGAILVPHERYLRPESFVAALTACARDRGVDVRSATAAVALRRVRNGTAGVETNDGSVDADQVVVAAGAWSSQVLASLDVHLPIQPGHGYAITVRRPGIDLKRPTYLAESRIACSPFDSALRLAGLMELSGIDLPLAPGRFGAIRHGADQYLVGWRGETEEQWVGPRPMTPDGLPVIGRIRGFNNLWVASGHAMLGLTLAPSTGNAIGELICSGRTGYDISAFDPARFH